MINNYCISPAPALRPYVNQYILSTSEGRNVTYTSQWPAAFEVISIFYLADRPAHQTQYTTSALSSSDNYLVGPVLHDNGMVRFDGLYHTFIIEFKSDGLNRIFRMPATEIANRILVAEDVFGHTVNDLNDALHNAKNVEQMAMLADRFLLNTLQSQTQNNHYSEGISFVVNKLNNCFEFESIPAYAAICNMSVRNFERKFTSQLGISPKQYMQLLRFEKALKIKLMHPNKNWTSIAHECGYYDQMHLIRYFNQFTNRNPGAFLSDEAKFSRACINIFDAAGSNFDLLNTQTAKERFIYTKRPDF